MDRSEASGPRPDRYRNEQPGHADPTFVPVDAVARPTGVSHRSVTLPDVRRLLIGCISFKGMLYEWKGHGYIMVACS